MNTSPPCVLFSQGPALAQRVTAILGTMAEVLQIESPGRLEAFLRQNNLSLLFLDMQAEGASDVLPRVRKHWPLTVVVAMGQPRSDPMLAAEALDVYAVEPLDLEHRALQALVARAIEYLRVLRENQVLKDEAAGAPTPKPVPPPRLDLGISMAPLQEFSRAFRHFDNVEALLESIAEGIATSSMVSRVGIFCRTRDSNTCCLRAGLRCLEDTSAMKFDEDDPFVQWLATHAHLVSLSNLEHVKDPLERDMLKQLLAGMGAEAIVPLQGRGKILGWIFVGRRSTGLPFEYADLEGLMAIADHVSVAIENALLYDEITVQKTLAETLLHSMPTGIVAVGVDGTVRWFNDAARTILDVLPEQALNHPIEALDSRLTDLVRRALNGRETPDRQEWIDFLTRRFLSVEMRRLMAGTQCVGAVALIHDLTVEKRLREQQEHLDRITFWTELAAAMSHEIRNPLVAISTFAQLLPERFSDPEFRNQFSQVVKIEVDRLNNIIEQINSFAHPHKLEFGPFDIRQAIEKAVDLARSLHPSMERVAVEVAVDERIPEVRGDVLALAECFAHVMGNSVEALANRTNPRISIKAKHSGNGDGPGGVVVTLCDNGSGIPARMLDKVFSPFCTTKAKGMGLGLPIAKRTVMDHSGQIHVDSDESGTCVTIVIPLLDREAGR